MSTPLSESDEDVSQLANALLPPPGNDNDCDESWARGSSEDDEPSENSPPPSEHVRTTSWWAPNLKSLLSHYRLENEQSHERTIVSACTGIFAEAEALKAGQGRVIVLQSYNVEECNKKLRYNTMT